MTPKHLFSPNQHKRLFLFHYTSSSKSTTNTCNKITPMMDYLTNSLGFSNQEAIITSSKITPIKSTKNPHIVINFFLNHGFTKPHLKRLILYHPKILSCNVGKTLMPKLDAFRALGLTGPTLADVIASNPDVLRRSLNGHILPTLDVLRSVFNDNVMLVKSLKSSSLMLAPSCKTNVRLNVALLRSYGLSDDQIKLFLVRKSKYFVFEPKWLQGVLDRVEKFGIDRNSGMFFHGLVSLCSISEECLECKMQVFRSFGWSECDILVLAKRSPYAFNLSESKLRKGLNLFMNDLGYQPLEIASRSPCILTFSFEKRVIPRYLVVKVLQEKNLLKRKRTCGVFTYLRMTNSAFYDRFVIPNKDKVPGLYDDYMERVCSPLVAAECTTNGVLETSPNS